MSPPRERDLSRDRNTKMEEVKGYVGSRVQSLARIFRSPLAFSFHPRQSSFPRVPFFAGSFTHVYIPPLSISFPGNRWSLIKTTSVRSKSFRSINPEMNAPHCACNHSIFKRFEWSEVQTEFACIIIYEIIILK